MMGWVRKHPYVALSLGYVLMFAFGTGVWLVAQRDLMNALITAFIWSLLYWLFSFFQLRRRRKAKARLESHGQIMIHLRYPDSRRGSLDSIWNQGIATPGPQLLTFQPAVYDTLEPSGKAVTFKIAEHHPEHRKLTREDRKYVPGFGCQAMTLMTDDGKVEIAAPPDTLNTLIDVLARR